MPRRCTILSAVAAGLAVWACALPAQALLKVTNGGFDIQDASFNNNPAVSPTGWFTGSVAANTFSDSILNSLNGVQGRWLGNAFQLGNNTPFPADGTTEIGYAYQPLGTYAGEASITVVGYVFNRISPANPLGNFDVSIFAASPANFTGADGTDISFNVPPVAAPMVYTAGTDFMITQGTTPQRARWTYTAALTGGVALPGDTIWLRIGDGGNPTSALADEPIIDDVSLMPFPGPPNNGDLGDVNGDNIVDIATDFTAIKNNFRKTVTSRAQGDLDGSGDVDFFDYLQWRQKFLGAGGVAADIPSLVGVPEPGSCALAAIALASLAGAMRRRTH